MDSECMHAKTDLRLLDSRFGGMVQNHSVSYQCRNGLLTTEEGN